MESVQVKLDPRKTALITIDMINAMLEEKGRGGVWELWKFCDEHNIGKNVARSLEICRKHDVFRVHIQHVLRPGAVGKPDVGIWKAFMEMGCGEEGTWDDDFISDAKPQLGPREIIVQKHRASAFFDTDLDRILRNLGINSLIFQGCISSFCVNGSIMSALDLDYLMTVLPDCVVSPNVEVTDTLSKHIWPLLGCNVISVSQLEEALK
jgi:ureidoacrylate peracid hydrolase